jgi:hypothetical protein
MMVLFPHHCLLLLSPPAPASYVRKPKVLVTIEGMATNFDVHVDIGIKCELGEHVDRIQPWVFLLSFSIRVITMNSAVRGRIH